MWQVRCQTSYQKILVIDYMDEIIDFVQVLIDKGYAYEASGDVYFRVERQGICPFG